MTPASLSSRFACGALLLATALGTPLTATVSGAQAGTPVSLAGRWELRADAGDNPNMRWPTRGVLTLEQHGDSLHGTVAWTDGPSVGLSGRAHRDSLELYGAWHAGLVVNGRPVDTRTELRGTVVDGGALTGEIGLRRRDNRQFITPRRWRAQRSAPDATGSESMARATPSASSAPGPDTTSTLEARLSRALADLVSRQRLVGATAAVSIDGRITAVAAGYADREARVAMRPDDRMLAGSTGKMLVAATALALATERRLDLDAPVSRWLGGEPWFSRVPNAARLTMRHLLSHRGGVPDYVDDPAFVAAVRAAGHDPALLQRARTPAELIAFVLDDPPPFEPGRGFLYSDTGYLLAGLVIERVAGRGFYEELTARILTPLALASTSPADRVDLPGLVPGYLVHDNPLGLPSKIVEQGRLLVNPASEWTGGGIISNASDLARFAETLFESERWGEVRATMVTPPDSLRAYGFGVAITRTPRGPLYGHSGWFAGYRTEVAYSPTLGLAIAFQTNTDRVDGGEAVRMLLDALR